ncbi:MAG TPA: hypothetical protein VGN57_21940, partial [Pirellulaceae bacterium]|nr:hypothetical protein [Pirellulaceae bacterium]
GLFVPVPLDLATAASVPLRSLRSLRGTDATFFLAIFHLRGNIQVPRVRRSKSEDPDRARKRKPG